MGRCHRSHDRGDVALLNQSDSSTVTVIGGSVRAFALEGWSTANLYRGNFGVLYASDPNSFFHVYGYGFRIEKPTDLWHLTGFWPDGIPLDMWLRRADRFGDRYVLHEVPEPMTMILLALGIPLLRRRRGVGRRSELNQIRAHSAHGKNSDMFDRGALGLPVRIVAAALLGLLSVPSHGTLPSDFELDAPGLVMQFDVAGYSDWGDWYPTDRHPHDQHEMLSGEWAAAIWYDGIGTGDDAMWLTDWFSDPDWRTYTGFEQESYDSWDDPNNPIAGLDTAQSVISNGQVRITIDYEMADLGEQGPGGEGGSPMVFYQGGAGEVRPERPVRPSPDVHHNQYYRRPHRGYRVLPDASRPPGWRERCRGLFDV